MSIEAKDKVEVGHATAPFVEPLADGVYVGVRTNYDSAAEAVHKLGSARLRARLESIAEFAGAIGSSLGGFKISLINVDQPGFFIAGILGAVLAIGLSIRAENRVKIIDTQINSLISLPNNPDRI